MLKAELADSQVEGQVAIANSEGITPGRAGPRRRGRLPCRGRGHRGRRPGRLRTGIAVHERAARPLRGGAAAAPSAAARARVVQVANLRPQVPETAGLDAGDHLQAVLEPRRPGRRLPLRPPGPGASAWPAPSTPTPPGSGGSGSNRSLAGRRRGATALRPRSADNLAKALRALLQSTVRSKSGGGTMTVRVGINGFGRIGRSFTRALLDRGTTPVSSSWRSTTPWVTATRWRSCSSTTPWAARCATTSAAPTTASRSTAATSSKLEVLDPAEIPWSDYGVDVVIESTGLFTAREKAAGHLGGSVGRVSSPRPAAMPTRPSAWVSTTTCTTPRSTR